jgi:hypothetical protein
LSTFSSRWICAESVAQPRAPVRRSSRASSTSAAASRSAVSMTFGQIFDQISV